VLILVAVSRPSTTHAVSLGTSPYSGVGEIVMRVKLR
jgi:hypothetical protein